MSFFKDKVVVITGGSEGIGKALVNTFIDAGAKVATCARNYDKLYNLQLRHTSVELSVSPHTGRPDGWPGSSCPAGGVPETGAASSPTGAFRTVIAVPLDLSARGHRPPWPWWCAELSDQ